LSGSKHAYSDEELAVGLGASRGIKPQQAPDHREASDCVRSGVGAAGGVGGCVTRPFPPDHHPPPALGWLTPQSQQMSANEPNQNDPIFPPPLDGTLPSGEPV
jgi:hypothetical protein